MTALGGLGARAWDILLASHQEEQHACKAKKGEGTDAGYPARQEPGGKAPPASQKPQAGKMSLPPGHCGTVPAMLQRRLRTVAGMRHTHQTLEEPCAGKLARTVVRPAK